MYRTKEDWAILINDLNICKKKLESKTEALKILLDEKEQAQVERDVLKNKCSQQCAEISGMREVLESYNHKSSMSGVGEDAKKLKTVSNLLQFARDENEMLKKDLQQLKQLYSECQKDNLSLHATVAQHAAKHQSNTTQDKHKLILQLEESNGKVLELEQELQICHDENKQIQAEKEDFGEKNTRLNAELNYILHNDDNRIVDVDSLVLENKYLKEVVKQYKEEKSCAIATAARYKDAYKQRKSSSKKSPFIDLNTVNSKQLDALNISTSNQTVQQLQRVNKALTETLSEKNLALKHQRNTNRVLGARVSELEKKLRTLEVSGLWSHEQRTPRHLEEGDFRETTPERGRYEESTPEQNNNNNESIENQLIEINPIVASLISGSDELLAGNDNKTEGLIVSLEKSFLENELFDNQLPAVEPINVDSSSCVEPG